MSIPPEKYYLNIGRAGDLKNPKERFVYRLLEIMPGFLIWLTLLAMIIASWLKPVWATIFIIAFSFYWLVRVAYFVFHLVASYRKMKRNLKINWLERLSALAKNDPAKNWLEIYQLIIFPIYKENWEIARTSFQALADSDFPKERMVVVLATEEKAGESAQVVAKNISQEFAAVFPHFLVTCHPQDLPGEIAGKGANGNWAARSAKEKIIDALSIPYENIIVSFFDIDTQVFPQYFSCLTYHYLTSKNPCRASFQPIPLYLNNLWEAPFFSRLVSFSNVFWQMLQQQRPEVIVTYSSHSMSFKALTEMDFWQDRVVCEDAGIFWKSYLFYDGEYKVVPLHYPLSMDSCVAKSFWGTVANQYKQQRRWAWGSEAIPYLLFGFLKNKNLPLKKKFNYPLLIIEGFWAWATNPLLILFLGWLPLLLGGEQFKSTVLAYNLPQTTQALMTLGMAGVVTSIVISALLLNPRPAWCQKRKKISMYLQWLFFPVTFIIFGAIPAIDAQTRLMLAKYLGFSVTEKARHFPNNPRNNII